ncbi:MAG: superoxide dismutase family protein [Parvularculaceae bacterium]
MPRCNPLNFAGKIAFSSLAALTVAACGSGGVASPLLADLAPAGGADATGVLVSPDGEEIGQLTFTQGPRGVVMRVDIAGLTEGWHGIHLHNVADCSDGADGFKKSGGHINPDSVEHGLLNPAGAHLADIPNIYADADGRATAEIYRADVSLDLRDGLFLLLDDDGFAVIVHAQPDDHMTQPIGGAGARVACAAVSN